MDTQIKEKKKVGRPKTKNISTPVIPTEDIGNGIFSISSLSKGGPVGISAAELIAAFWTESPYADFRPRGLYATYGGKEAYVVIRDDETPPFPSLGKDVYVLAGIEDKNKENIYAVVKSKCNFHSFGKTFSGKPTQAKSFDGYYTIIPSQEDVDSKTSPIRIISCKNFKNSTLREKYIATNITPDVIKAI